MPDLEGRLLELMRPLGALGEDGLPDGACCMKYLAERTGTSVPAVTVAARRLREAGLAGRLTTPSPAESIYASRRIVLYALTPEGVRFVEGV